MTSSPTTVAQGPLEVVEGRFLGIGHGSRISEAERVLGVPAILEHAGQIYTQSNSTIQVPACLTPPGDHWAIYADGLNLFFEGSSKETAAITNWNYTGGPVAGFTQMVDSSGLTIGDTQQEIETAYPSLTNYSDEVFITGMRLGLEGDSIVWFGDVDCALETEIDDGASTTTTLQLVPPDDPAALVGAIITSSRSPQTADMVAPPVSINGVDTNLSERGGACLDNGCTLAVALLADGPQPVGAEAQYLLVEESIGQDELNRPIWRVIDVITVRPASEAEWVQLDPVGDMCSLSDRAGDQKVIAAMMTSDPPAPHPVQVWDWNAPERSIQPLPADTLIDCVPVGD